MFLLIGLLFTIGVKGFRQVPTSIMKFPRSGLITPHTIRTRSTHAALMISTEGKESLKLPRIDISPTTSTSFRELITSGSVFVDKTEQIKTSILDNRSGRYITLARPRGFGKSLTCSVVEAAFSGAQAQELFTGTYLGSDGHWDFAEEQCPVIKLSLAGLGKSPKEIKTTLTKKLHTIGASYGYSKFDLDYGAAALRYPGQLLDSLVNKLHRKYKKDSKYGKVVVLIDDYDAPLLECLHQPPKIFQQMRRDLDNFLVPLKALGACIRLVFVTGVTKFPKDSLFNNIFDITHFKDAADLMGYTSAEIENHFPQHLQNLRTNHGHADMVETLQVLKDTYGGYSFGVFGYGSDVSPSMHNPLAVNGALYDGALTQHWLDSGNTSSVLKLLAGKTAVTKYRRGELLHAIRGIDERTPSSMMVDAGYQTIKSVNEHFVTVGYPNTAIAKALTADADAGVEEDGHTMLDRSQILQHTAAMLMGLPRHLD